MSLFDDLRAAVGAPHVLTDGDLSAWEVDWRKRFSGLTTEGKLGREQVLLLKPQTYMNESGRAAGEAARFYKLDPADIIFFHDELDLVPGKVRVKAGGGVAGHNGLRSITAHLGNDYVRVRIGIGHPGSRDLVKNWVLQNFVKSDREWLEPLLGATAKAARELADGANDKFQSFVAHAMHTEAETADERPEPAPRKRKDTPSAASEKPAAVEGPFGKLRRWFGAS